MPWCTRVPSGEGKAIESPGIPFGPASGRASLAVLVQNDMREVILLRILTYTAVFLI
jgi:hypothetical protein